MTVTALEPRGGIGGSNTCNDASGNSKTERRSPSVHSLAEAPVRRRNREDRQDDDGTTSPAPSAGTSTVPPVTGAVAPLRAGAAPPGLRRTFHDSTSSHPSNGNDELDFLEGGATKAAAAASSVRRVRVPSHGIVKVASVEEDEDDDDLPSDEDRASPTSVTAGPGDPSAGPEADATVKKRDPAEAATTAAAVVVVGGAGSVEDELRLQLHVAEMQRQKMAANLRKKKAQLDEAGGTRKDLEDKVADLEASMAKLQTENDQLRAGLQKVVTTRDEMKNKLRIKNELIRELRADKDDAERRLRRSENQRATEQELLANYRRLATHTGYFKWGKTIRVLEAALEQHNASAEAAPAPGGGGGGASSGCGHGGGGNNNNSHK